VHNASIVDENRDILARLGSRSDITRTGNIELQGLEARVGGRSQTASSDIDSLRSGVKQRLNKRLPESTIAPCDERNGIFDIHGNSSFRKNRTYLYSDPRFS
jgi:hypothetical protein